MKKLAKLTVILLALTFILAGADVFAQAKASTISFMLCPSISRTAQLKARHLSAMGSKSRMFLVESSSWNLL